MVYLTLKLEQIFIAIKPLFGEANATKIKRC
jgi:hypothetical protein